MGTVTDIPPLALAPNRLIVMPVSPSVASAPGTVSSYEAGTAGLAVHLTAEVSPRAAEQLDGQRTWITANVDGRLVAFPAVTRRSGAASLEASGITVPVEERRRRHLRAADRLPVRLRFLDDPGATVTARTIDLSRGGCRVEVTQSAAGQVGRVGAAAQVTLALPDGDVAATGTVLRAEGEEVVMRFTGVAPEAGDRLERHVLSLLW